MEQYSHLAVPRRLDSKWEMRSYEATGFTPESPSKVSEIWALSTSGGGDRSGHENRRAESRVVKQSALRPPPRGGPRLGTMPTQGESGGGLHASPIWLPELCPPRQETEGSFLGRLISPREKS